MDVPIVQGLVNTMNKTCNVYINITIVETEANNSSCYRRRILTVDKNFYNAGKAKKTWTFIIIQYC